MELWASPCFLGYFFKKTWFKNWFDHYFYLLKFIWMLLPDLRDDVICSSTPGNKGEVCYLFCMLVLAQRWWVKVPATWAECQGKFPKVPGGMYCEVCYNLQQIQNLVRGSGFRAELGSLSLSLSFLGCFVITTTCGWKPLFNNTSSLSVLEML